MTYIKETIQGLYALKTYLASKAIEEAIEGHGPARESLIGMQKVVDSAVNLLKEQDNWLGIRQTADGITYISSGTAKQGEKRGIMLGKALIYERLEKELLYRGLLTDDIRSVFVKVWGELE